MSSAGHGGPTRRPSAGLRGTRTPRRSQLSECRTTPRMYDLPVRRPVDFREGATGSRRGLHPRVQPSSSVSSCPLVALGLGAVGFVAVGFVAVGLVAVGLVALAGCAHHDD